MASSFYLYGGDYLCSINIYSYHVLCHCGMQGAASALSLKTVHRTVFTCVKFVPNFPWNGRLQIPHYSYIKKKGVPFPVLLISMA